MDSVEPVTKEIEMEIIAVLSLLVSVAFLVVFCIAVFRQQPVQQQEPMNVTFTFRTITVNPQYPHEKEIQNVLQENTW
jgi:hypothetical protein